MAPLKVTFIDEKTILSVKNQPLFNVLDSDLCGIRTLRDNVNKMKLRSTNTDSPLNYLPPIQEDDISQHSDVYFRPSELIEGDKENMKFEFSTPNKSGNMMEKADSALRTKILGATPKTPQNYKALGTPKSSRTPRTPRTPQTPRTPTGKTPRATKSLYRTPQSKNETPNRRISKRRLSTSNAPETPYSFRRNVKKRIANELSEDSDDYDDSDVDANYSPSNSDASSNEDTEEEIFATNDSENPTKNFRGKRTPLKGVKFPLKSLSRTPLRTPRRGRELKVDIDMAATTDDYFEHNSEFNACITSDHTLNRLERPRLGPEALKSLLEGTVEYHEKERQELIEDHMSLFPHWMTLLCQGFNIFLCGVGSKKYLLSLFQEQFLPDLDHLVINGFFPSLTVKTILISIIEEVLEMDSHPAGIVDQLKLISNHYNNADIDPLFLIINNLDGPMLRNEKAQSILAQLASFKSIHLLASVDHINSPLIFDGNKYSLYNPLWWDATTLAPYTEETSYENSLLVQQSGGLALSSLLHVFKSLTPNAKGIFILLAKYQLSEKDNPNYAGMSFGDLYQRCREAFLVNSDLTLRAQLTEFKDHKLIKFKKGFDGVENLTIPLEGSTLDEFLDQYEEL